MSTPTRRSPEKWTLLSLTVYIHLVCTMLNVRTYMEYLLWLLWLSGVTTHGWGERELLHCCIDGGTPKLTYSHHIHCGSVRQWGWFAQSQMPPAQLWFLPLLRCSVSPGQAAHAMPPHYNAQIPSRQWRHRLTATNLTCSRDRTRGHYERDLLHGGISRISKISHFSEALAHSGGSLESLKSLESPGSRTFLKDPFPQDPLFWMDGMRGNHPPHYESNFLYTTSWFCCKDPDVPLKGKPCFSY